MSKDLSDWMDQKTGVRQGCTLSPLLFIISLSRVMNEVAEEVRASLPLSFTPLFNFVDLEYADDTVIVAKTVTTANLALASLLDKA
eukprot:6102895-Alexandrium_andersonii.AAC.1